VGTLSHPASEGHGCRPLSGNRDSFKAVFATVFDALWHALRWTWHDPDGYNIVSGPLADITLIGAAYVFVRRHNCHVNRCWRLGRHPVAGTGYIVCRKHHPDDSPTAEKVLAAHRAAQQSSP
jgi:hypothetical protein